MSVLRLHHAENRMCRNFTVETGSTLSLDTSRKITSVAAGTRYLVADGLDAANATLQAGNFTAGADIGSVTDDSGQIYAVSSGWVSPYQATVDKWANQQSSANALELLLSDRFLVGDAQADAIRDNLSDSTPDQVLNQAIASLQRSGFVADSALGLAFMGDILDRRFAAAVNGDNALASLADSRRRGLRAWGGYIGYFDRVDSHAGRRGYRQTVNGGLAGLTFDFASASVGAYFGYTRGNTRVRNQASRVESDGYHFGLLGRVAPLAALPAFSLTLDGGFSYYDNETRRHDGVGRIHADFSQRTWTAGLGLEYEFDLCWAYLAPYAEFRYTYLDQNAASERGGLTQTRTDGLDGESLASELGLRLSKDIRASWGVFSPYVAAGWRHEFGDRELSGTSRYTLDNHYAGALPTFGMDSARRDRDSAVLGIGLRLRKELSECRAIGLRAGYTATLNSHATSHAVSGIVTFEF